MWGSGKNWRFVDGIVSWLDFVGRQSNMFLEDFVEARRTSAWSVFGLNFVA
jgi:hypothetical protein